MKKFEQLGRKLSTIEQKSIMGGLFNQDAAKSCVNDGDCGVGHYTCPDTNQQVDANGKCYNGTCRYGYVCVGKVS